jgi:alkylation response protein AidB-like acyl-CoA dehydrogenase
MDTLASAAAAETDFFQAPPRLGNTFEADAPLRETLERLLPPELRAELLPEWRALGHDAASRLAELAREAETDPPRHVPFDAWGRRVDQVRCAPAWKALQDESARLGLVALPYEGRHGASARVHQFALLHLFAPSSAIFTCYLAMTDGAARTLLEHDHGLAARVVPHLVSRDPASFWTAGQWMTERSGGSDVGRTLTQARRDETGAFRLHGTKWFTSAVTSEVALTLARPEGAPEGSRGLSLFLVELRRPDGSLNGLRVLRLKDKLGTRALPTAELELDGTLAVPVGGLGDGVKKISALLNLTRLHNSVNACALMARLLHLQRDYAARRVAFGRPLAGHPLHRETLAGLHVEYEAALALTFDCARLLGRQEAGEASAEERAALRLLTPLAKLSTAKQAVASASEGLEGFGGAGYVEDTGLPVILRDAQVLPIWEGTTNVLALDVLRPAAREGALAAWLDLTRRRLEPLSRGPLGASALDARRLVDDTEAAWQATLAAGDAFTEAAARALALRLAALSAAVPLLEQGAWGIERGRGERSARAARRFLATRVPALHDPGDAEDTLATSTLLSGV